jgi:hypothetical protein
MMEKAPGTGGAAVLSKTEWVSQQTGTGKETGKGTLKGQRHEQGQ